MQIFFFLSLVQYLTVFTFTPSWGVCLVVRLYPSIFWASSPTTAGLGETVAQVKREQQHSSFRKRSPCEFKQKKKNEKEVKRLMNMYFFISAQMKGKLPQHFLGIIVPYSVRAAGLQETLWFNTSPRMNLLSASLFRRWPCARTASAIALRFLLFFFFFGV